MNTSENISKTLNLTAASFEAEVLKSKQPVLVVFSATWSQPCRLLDPILQELARDWAGKVKVLNVNADDSLDLSLCYDIKSVPTLLCFVEGKLRLRIVGTVTKAAIIAKLKAFGLADQTDSVAKGASGTGAATSEGGLI
jgi:thioredoxin 1